MKTSNLYRLNFNDFTKGLIVAVITSVIATSGQAIDTWLTTSTFTIDKATLILALKAALAGGVGYLIKNFFTPSQTVTPVNKS